MDVTYRLKPEELNDEFLKTIKQMFLGKEVAITVEDVPLDPFYCENNMAAIDDAARQINQGRVIVKTLEEVEAMVNE